MKPMRVVVVGHGIAPAMAVTALRRAFARGGLSVEWIETPDVGVAQRTVSALPNLRSFHRLLGISEADLLRAAKGTLTLGRHYVGFAPGTDWLHSYGPVGRPFESLPFGQFWIKASAAGFPQAYDHFSREAVAARNGRIRIADDAQGAALAYGYQLDAAGYAALLRAAALAAGVTISRDAAPVALVAEGRVSALRLSNGRIVEGDLFIDALGSIRSALGNDDVADAAVSGCDRIITGSAPALGQKPLYGRVTTHRAGWAALTPLQDRTGIAIAYDSKLVSDAEAAQLAGAPFTSQPTVSSLAPFHRARPWAGNVVAIGDAGAVLEPLGGFELHRLQVACTHLASLFPVETGAMPEAGIYNEELAVYHARLQDFDAAQYSLNRREEPFWQAARARPRSPELEARISLFAARGMVIEFNQDSFAPDEWQALLLGSGVTPRSYDPQVDRIDERAVMADFHAQLSRIQADVTAMESHDAALARALRP